MRAALGDGVRWLPGATCHRARCVARARRTAHDLPRAHDVAEGIASPPGPAHRAPVVSTRHFAARRRLQPRRAPCRVVDLTGPRPRARRQRLRRPAPRTPSGRGDPERRPTLTVPLAERSRVVLVLQRLEPEKDTITALRAWKASQARAGRLVAARRGRRVGAVGPRGLGGVGTTSRRRVHRLDGRRRRRVRGCGDAPRTRPRSTPSASASSRRWPPACPLSRVRQEATSRPSACFQAPRCSRPATRLPRLRLCVRSAPGTARSELSDAGRQLVSRDFTVAHHVDQLLAEYDGGSAVASRRSLRALGLRTLMHLGHESAPRAALSRTLRDHAQRRDGRATFASSWSARSSPGTTSGGATSSSWTPS